MCMGASCILTYSKKEKNEDDVSQAPNRVSILCVREKRNR